MKPSLLESSRRGVLAAFVRNPVFANLLAVTMLVGGGMAAWRLQRETYPETAINYVLVTVPYLGAGPADVEEGVCLKIEQAIEGIPGVWEISSLSEENVCNLGAAFDTTITSATEVLRQVQGRVDAISTFPEATEKPIVVEVLARFSVISIGVHGDAPETSIRRFAEQIKSELIALPGISQVTLAGVREYEISIQLRKETLDQYGLTLQQVMDMVAANSLNVPAGTVRAQNEEISIRTRGQRYSKSEFEDLVVIAQPDGTSVRLGQIARIRDTLDDEPLFGRVNGDPGATVVVWKTPKEDISAVAQLVRDYVSQVTMPEGIRLTVLADKSRDVDQRMTMILSNAFWGLVLVVVSLLLFVDVRSAIAVALGIPVSYAGALMILHQSGGTINLISLLGMLIATGIIVDDAIIIAESVREKVREGLPLKDAAVAGTQVMFVPVALASLTTMVAFVPLMFVVGVMGKLIFVLPVVVIACIAASTVEAFFILPGHLWEWGTEDENRIAGWRRRGRAFLDARIDRFIQGPYARLLRIMLQWRVALFGGAVTAVLLCVGVVISGRTPFVLFPKADVNTLRARVRFPEGTPFEMTAAAALRLEEAARSLNSDAELKPRGAGSLVRHVYAVVGEWPDIVPKRSSALAEVTIELMPAEERRIDAAGIIQHWRDLVGGIPGADLVAITREELGPTEKPLEIRLLGDDLEDLRRAADELEAKLAEFAGVFDIDDDLIPGKRELQVALRPEAATLGLTVVDLAAQLRQGLYGGEAVRLQRGRDEVKVMVRYVNEDRRTLAVLDDLRIRTRQGAAVPFHEVAETRLVRGYSGIWRQDGKRRVRVQADVDERLANAEQIIQSLEASYLPELAQRYEGLSIVLDGQRARIRESLTSLVAGAAIALVVMYTLLALPLKSYVQPMIIMIAIPFGLIGAVVGHAVMGYELSLMSVFGMVGLAGITVNDAVVLIDRINLNLARGLNVFDAVWHSGQARFRAVILTSLTTIAGLSPLLFERSSQAQSLIPLTISLAFGLLFSTVLTLLIVPAMFLLVNDLKRAAHWLRHGGLYPHPEQVEGAALAQLAAVE